MVGGLLERSEQRGRGPVDLRGMLVYDSVGSNMTTARWAQLLQGVWED